MPQANKVSVIGIGYRPLGKPEREIVLAAGTILTSDRLLDVFKRYDEFSAVQDRIKVITKVPDTVAFIREWFSQPATRPLVLLASGDPLFFGIGRRMIEEFGNKRVAIYPDLSSVQNAFARINTAWDDAFFISLHGGPDIAKRRKLPYEAKDIPALLERYGKLGILTDRENNPGVVARVLNSELRTPHSELIMHVCERLGYPDEKISTGTPAEMAGKTFSNPNVVVVQQFGVPPIEAFEGRLRSESGVLNTNAKFGLREDEIKHERGMITKDEVRAVTIHKLRLPEKGVLWDIGAGSGSVSVEAARMCPGLRVIAIEKEPDRAGGVETNIKRYNAGNVELVQGAAPDALAGLPAPDRVFIGGSGGSLNDIIETAAAKMPAGIMVINAVTLNTLHSAVPVLERLGFRVDVAQISVSRSKVVSGVMHLSAMNPVFIISGEK